MAKHKLTITYLKVTDQSPAISGSPTNVMYFLNGLQGFVSQEEVGYGSTLVIELDLDAGKSESVNLSYDSSTKGKITVTGPNNISTEKLAKLVSNKIEEFYQSVADPNLELSGFEIAEDIIYFSKA